MSSESDTSIDKAKPKYRWIDGSVYLDVNELAKSRSFQEKVRQTAELQREIRRRDRRNGVD